MIDILLYMGQRRNNSIVCDKGQRDKGFIYSDINVPMNRRGKDTSDNGIKIAIGPSVLPPSHH